MHCLIMQDCFMRPGPPNFFMSLQKWHSPHSVRRQASHFRQRVLLRLAPDELRLDGSLTADDDVVPILGLGRLAARCWKANNESGWRLSVKGSRRFIPGYALNSSLLSCWSARTISWTNTIMQDFLLAWFVRRSFYKVKHLNYHLEKWWFSSSGC